MREYTYQRLPTKSQTQTSELTLYFPSRRDLFYLFCIYDMDPCKPHKSITIQSGKQIKRSPERCSFCCSWECRELDRFSFKARILHLGFNWVTVSQKVLFIRYLQWLPCEKAALVFLLSQTGCPLTSQWTALVQFLYKVFKSQK